MSTICFFWLQNYETRNKLQEEKMEKHWRLHSMLLKKKKDQWINYGGIKKYLETSENKNTTFQGLWDTAKAVLRVKFIVI